MYPEELNLDYRSTKGCALNMQTLVLFRSHSSEIMLLLILKCRTFLTALKYWYCISGIVMQFVFIYCNQWVLSYIVTVVVQLAKNILTLPWVSRNRVNNQTVVIYQTTAEKWHFIYEYGDK